MKTAFLFALTWAVILAALLFMDHSSIERENAIGRTMNYNVVELSRAIRDQQDKIQALEERVEGMEQRLRVND